MKRYTSKIARRYGENLQLKGERDASPKAAIRRKPYPPGMHGKSRRRRITEYGRQLAEKQKLKAIYGVTERQFLRYFKEASKVKERTDEFLLQEFERRLDNVVWRLGWADSRAQARQMINHGHIVVNGRKLNIPSYQVKIGDELEVRAKSRDLKLFANLKDRIKNKEIQEWLLLKKTQPFKAKIVSLPKREEVNVPVDMPQVIQFYSR